MAVHPMSSGFLTVVSVSRADIESMATAGLVELLRLMVSDTAALRASLLGLVVTTSGFESDFRALDDVPEVRAFVAAVSRKCPWWGHTMHQGVPELSTFVWWSRALAEKSRPNRYSEDGSCQTWIDRSSHGRAVTGTLAACLTIYRDAIDRGDLTDDEAGTMCSPLLAALDMGPTAVRQ